MARLSIPTNGRLSADVRLPPSHSAVQKALSRLSRPSLLVLVLDWLSDDSIDHCMPYLGNNDDDDSLYTPAASLDELRASYEGMQYLKGSKRAVFDRITEGDWRHGLSLYQLAMADAQYLQDQPMSQKWTAYQISLLKEASNVDDEEQAPEIDKESLLVPRFHPSTFVQNLESHVLPDVKPYCYMHRPQDLALTLLRIFIVESPYTTSLARLNSGSVSSDAEVDSSRTLYVAFPDVSPYIYLSKLHTVGPLGAAESKSFRNLVAEGIPKALSRPQERYTLKPTQISTKNLYALLHTRGGFRTNAAGGGWSIYADKDKKESPLDTVLPTPPLSDESSDDNLVVGGNAGSKRRVDGNDDVERLSKRARLGAQARFGDTARVDDGLGVERMDITVEDSFRSRSGGGLGDEADVASDASADGDESSSWAPNVKLTFHGPHVFAGMRQLVENGILDARRMPGWLTGEEGVTIGAVRDGKIRGHKGSGI